MALLAVDPQAAALSVEQVGMATVRLAMQCSLHPESGMHASWLPEDWPHRYRHLDRLAPSARTMVGQMLTRRGLVPQMLDLNFDTPVRRLALMDPMTLRRLAVYCGVAAHGALVCERTRLGALLRRKLAALDADACDFIARRVPALTALPMATQGFAQHPHGVPRVVVERGHRLLLGLAAQGGEATLQRIRLKLPKRQALLRVPEFTPVQSRQLHEVVFLCLIPERFASWDWLF